MAIDRDLYRHSNSSKIVHQQADHAGKIKKTRKENVELEKLKFTLNRLAKWTSVYKFLFPTL